MNAKIEHLLMEIRNKKKNKNTMEYKEKELIDCRSRGIGVICCNALSINYI
jgi:hypothetical protein